MPMDAGSQGFRQLVKDILKAKKAKHGPSHGLQQIRTRSNTPQVHFRTKMVLIPNLRTMGTKIT